MALLSEERKLFVCYMSRDVDFWVGSFLVVRGKRLHGAGESSFMLSLSDGVLRIVNQLLSFSLCKGNCSVHCCICSVKDQSTVFDLTGKRQWSKQIEQSTSDCFYSCSSL